MRRRPSREQLARLILARFGGRRFTGESLTGYVENEPRADPRAVAAVDFADELLTVVFPPRKPAGRPAHAQQPQPPLNTEER
jgi:hypothetical protein